MKRILVASPRSAACVLVLLTHLLNPIFTHAQQPGIAGAPSDRSVPIAPSSRSDAAMLALQNMLTALGGRDVWGRLHGARISGSIQYSGASESNPFVWEDHWQGKYKMLRETHESGKVRRFLQDPDSDHKFQPPSQRPNGRPNEKISKTPSFDPVSGLVVYLPGAAIAHVLAHEEYQVSLVRSPKSIPDSDCVLIRKRPTSESQANVEVVICASKRDHQLIASSVGLENLLGNAARLREVIQYSSNFEINGAMVPSRVVVIPPGTKTKTINIQHVAFNPVLDSKAFAGGGK